MGWLAYALLRALGVIIRLGAPFYDWHWYVAVIPLLTVLPVCVAWRLTSGRPVSLGMPNLKSRSTETLLRGTFSGLIVLGIVGYNGFGQVVVLEPDSAEPVPISFWAYLDFRSVPVPILEDLRSAGGRIYFAAAGYFPPKGERGQELLEGMRRLADYGIEVYLATPAGSDFLSVPVYRDWIASTRAAADFVRREGLRNVGGFIGDAEPPFHTPGDIGGVDRAAFDQAVSDLRALIDDIHHDYPDLQIGVTALWAHYVDMLDGDPDLSVVMRSPVDPPGGWDFVNLMTYSSYFPPESRAYYVYLLERAMAQLYPVDQVSHLIGLVGGGMPGEPLLDFDDLVRDARLSRALRVREIAVFQLDGALRLFGEDFVRRLTVAVNGPQSDSALAVPFSRPVSLLFYGLLVADALMDVRGHWGWLWIGWVALSGAIVARLTLRQP